MREAEPRPDPIRVCVEPGRRRVFASALDWPGWARSGRDEAAALEALASYAGRYAAVAEAAGFEAPHPGDAGTAPRLHVVERLPVSADPDFGVPGRAAALEAAPLGEAEAGRRAALVAAAWEVFDAVAARTPASLRKGPRGGGRDRDAIVAHVVQAEAQLYVRKLGLPATSPTDPASLGAHRGAILRVLREARTGAPPSPRGWLPRYAARRIAWHVVDHAWEMEDRSPGAP